MTKCISVLQAVTTKELVPDGSIWPKFGLNTANWGQTQSTAVIFGVPVVYMRMDAVPVTGVDTADWVR